MSEVSSKEANNAEANNNPSEEEIYGYGVYNATNNCLIPKLGGPVDKSVLGKTEAIEHLHTLGEEYGIDHLRIVKVGLANVVDEEAMMEYKEKNSRKELNI